MNEYNPEFRLSEAAPTPRQLSLLAEAAVDLANEHELFKLSIKRQKTASYFISEINFNGSPDIAERYSLTEGVSHRMSMYHVHKADMNGDEYSMRIFDVNMVKNNQDHVSRNERFVYDLRWNEQRTKIARRTFKIFNEQLMGVENFSRGESLAKFEMYFRHNNELPPIADDVIDVQHAEAEMSEVTSGDIELLSQQIERHFDARQDLKRAA